MERHRQAVARGIEPDQLALGVAGIQQAAIVRVEKGADVRNCILFKGTVIQSDAVVRHVIADKYVRIRPGCTLIGNSSYPLAVARGSVAASEIRAWFRAHSVGLL